MENLGNKFGLKIIPFKSQGHETGTYPFVPSDSFNELIALGVSLLEKMSLPDTAEDLLTEDSVLKVLSGYLPKSLRRRDRKGIDEYVPEFVAQVNGLTKKKRNFIKRRLSSMEPAGGRQLQAASTRVDSIRSILEKLLDDAKKYQ